MYKQLIITLVLLAGVVAIQTPHTVRAQCALEPEPGSCNSVGGLNHADQHINSDMPHACNAISSVEQKNTGTPGSCG